MRRSMAAGRGGEHPLSVSPAGLKEAYRRGRSTPPPAGRSVSTICGRLRRLRRERPGRRHGQGGRAGGAPRRRNRRAPQRGVWASRRARADLAGRLELQVACQTHARQVRQCMYLEDGPEGCWQVRLVCPQAPSCTVQRLRGRGAGAIRQGGGGRHRRVRGGGRAILPIHGAALRH